MPARGTKAGDAVSTTEYARILYPFFCSLRPRYSQAEEIKMGAAAPLSKGAFPLPLVSRGALVRG